MAYTTDPIQRSLNRRKALLGSQAELAQKTLGESKTQLLDAIVYASEADIAVIKSTVETIDDLLKDIESQFRSAIIAWHNSREFKGYDD